VQIRRQSMRSCTCGGECMSTNEYGLDTSYMAGKLKIFLRDINRHTPDEAARVLARLSKVADEKVLREPEFNERDTYRELCGELLKVLVDAQNTLAHCKAGVGYAHRQTDTAIRLNAAITKAGAILGEK
jgi:hypothetical protein